MDYEDFRKKISHKIEDRVEWKTLATFVPNKKLPVYNWFYFKEGFARDLVFNVLDMFKAKDGVVLDPFCGSGTTLLACKERGIDSVGIDALPITAFATKAKINDYDIKELQHASQQLFSEKFEKIDHKFEPIMKRSFSKYALEDVAFFHSHIDSFDTATKEFFLLALVRSAMRCSFAWKDGSVIKFKKRPVPPLKKMYKHDVKQMINDVKKLNARGNVQSEEGDARMLNAEDDSIEFVVTSPPYLNQIDYENIYAIESTIAQLQKRGRSAIRSASVSEHIGFRGIEMPALAVNYFTDMERALSEMYRVARDGAKIAIVVGNGYVGEIIESDLILSYIARELGFDITKILTLNKRFALEQRTKKRGLLRESMIILKK